MAPVLPPDISMDWNISESTDQVFDRASLYVADLIKKTLLTHEFCRIVVSGGHSVQSTLERLAQLSISWQKILVFVADERCVEVNDKLRNDKLIRETLVDPTCIPIEHFFNIHAELGGRTAAVNYRDTLANISNFDIALLGVGPDGHIGSLFPNHHSITNTELALFITDSPKEPSNRVSVGIGMLQRTTHRIVVVVGDDKSAMISLVGSGADLPVTLFEPTKWFLDSAAAGYKPKLRSAEKKEKLT